MTKKKRYNLCFRSLFSLLLMYIYIYYLYRKKRRDDRGCRRRKKSQTIDRVCESARRPMVSLQQFSQARVFGGCSSLESLCLLERVYGPKEFGKIKKIYRKKREKNKKNWGINIWRRACVRSSCWPPSNENAKAIHTHTHIYSIQTRQDGRIYIVVYKATEWHR